MTYLAVYVMEIQGVCTYWAIFMRKLPLKEQKPNLLDAQGEPKAKEGKKYFILRAAISSLRCQSLGISDDSRTHSTLTGRCEVDHFVMATDTLAPYAFSTTKLLNLGIIKVSIFLGMPHM